MISLAIEIDIRALMYSDLFLLLLVVVSSSFCKYIFNDDCVLFWTSSFTQQY